MRVGEFLKRFPEFEFDLVDHVAACDARGELEARWRRFVAALPESAEARRAELERALPELARALPAYATATALEAVRLCDKDSLRRDPLAYLRVDCAPVLVRKETSGTTGPPVPIFYHPDFYRDQLYLTVRKIAARAGHSVDDREVSCLAITDNRGCRDFVLSPPDDVGGLSLQVVVDEARTETLIRLSRLWTALRPAAVTAKPSLLEVLEEKVLRAGSEELPPPELIISSGAALDERLRQRLEERLRAPIVNAYGTTELGLVASECRARRGLHVDVSAVLAEIVDGELVLSGDGNCAMPLLRYRTGDLATLASEPCPCGARGPRLVSLSGRRVRCFRFGDVLFSPTHLNDLFRNFPLREFQVTQLDGARVEVLIQPTAPADGDARLIAAIGDHVARTLPVPVAVDVSVTTFRRDGKFERYRTLLPDGAA